MKQYAQDHVEEVRGGNVEMWAFECNPDNMPLLSNAADDLIKTYPNMKGHVHVIMGAAWNSTGNITFHTDVRDVKTGGSIYTSPYAQGKTVVVPSFDMASWMHQHLKPENEIFMKIDIEGAEFPVLKRMLDDGVASWVHEWKVEFHAGKNAGSDNPWQSPDTDLQLKNRFFDLVHSHGMIFHRWG